MEVAFIRSINLFCYIINISYTYPMPNWANILQDKFLALYGFAGSLISTVFLSPPRYVWGIAGLLITGGSFGLYLHNRFVESNPN